MAVAYAAVGLGSGEGPRLIAAARGKETVAAPPLVHGVWRGTGAVEDVVWPDGRPLRFPPNLETLFRALAADTRRPIRDGEADDGLVAFKSVGHLVATLSVWLHRTFTRSALSRDITALRRCLDGQLPGGRALIQHNRWLGWRVAFPRSRSDSQFACAERTLRASRAGVRRRAAMGRRAHARSRPPACSRVDS